MFFTNRTLKKKNNNLFTLEHLGFYVVITSTAIAIGFTNELNQNYE